MISQYTQAANGAYQTQMPNAAWETMFRAGRIWTPLQIMATPPDTVE
jgi:hypothetical protein